MSAHFLAVDLGASSGRVVLGRWDGERFELEELHRFPNEPVQVLGHVHWNVLGMWEQIQLGLRRYRQQHGRDPSGIGVDTWGVDYALLDSAGRLLGPPYHYRDVRTEGIEERAFAAVPRERIYARTGIQFMAINTLVQLTAMVAGDDPQLRHAGTLLMMPDLFHYWLTGRRLAEYTIASTSQLLDASSRDWATELIEVLGIPAAIFPEVVMPGTRIGPVLPEVAAEVGFSGEVPMLATGSHDTANAVAAVPGLDAESIYLSSGTWSLMGVETAEPVLSARALELNVTNEGGVEGTIRLLKNVAGLWLLQESRRQWQREGHDYSWDELLALAAEAAPFRSLIDPDAPEFLGHGDMPATVRAYCRRSGQPEPADVGAVVRCCLDSLALRYRWVKGALEELVERSLTVVRVVGGGSQNRLLNQLTADACACPVVAGPVEATALGNVLMQALASGHLSSLAEGRAAVAASVELERFEPRPDPALRAAYQRFETLLG